MALLELLDAVNSHTVPVEAASVSLCERFTNDLSAQDLGVLTGRLLNSEDIQEGGQSRWIVNVLSDATCKCISARKDVCRAAASAGALELVRACMTFPARDGSHLAAQYLEKASEAGHVDVVRFLLGQGADPVFKSNSAFRLAATNGHLEVVETLLQVTGVDPTACNSLALLRAIQNGHFNVVDLLLKEGRSNAGVYNSAGLLSALKNGNEQIAKRLLQPVLNGSIDPNNVDPQVYDGLTLVHAAENGLFQVVKLLVESLDVDPTLNNNRALKMARENGHQEIVEYLQARS